MLTGQHMPACQNTSVELPTTMHCMNGSTVQMPDGTKHLNAHQHRSLADPPLITGLYVQTLLRQPDWRHCTEALAVYDRQGQHPQALSDTLVPAHTVVPHAAQQLRPCYCSPLPCNTTIRDSKSESLWCKPIKERESLWHCSTWQQQCTPGSLLTLSTKFF